MELPVIIIIGLAIVVWIGLAVSRSNKGREDIQRGERSAAGKQAAARYAASRSSEYDDEDFRLAMENPSENLDTRVLKENLSWLQERWERAEAERKAGETSAFPAWYHDPITERQLAKLGRMGVAPKVKHELTKGQASDLIGLGEEAEPEHLEMLKFFKLPTRGMNQTRARAEVAKLMEDEANRDAWERRPATKEQRDHVKYFGEEVPKGLTSNAAEKLLDYLAEQYPEKDEEWFNLEEIFEEFADRDFREDYEIKKPSRTVIQQAIDALVAEGTQLKDMDPGEVADKVTELHPELARE